ncbi:hypothetical protein D3C81_1080370 [compost metagenome]
MDAERTGVLRDAAAHRRLGRVYHWLGGGEVRLADAHVHDMAAGALELGGLLGQFHHVEGIDVGDAGGGGKTLQVHGDGERRAEPVQQKEYV